MPSITLSESDKESKGRIACTRIIGSKQAPAKGARGNILAEDGGMSRMTPYGAGYNNR
jgi:hypothetical protein